ncbi:MAG: inositol monophosphatase [Spirochaetaceae bacterium]|nr:MAG: inositol monophosphatase [Spirochaetaceae bacterium]
MSSDQLLADAVAAARIGADVAQRYFGTALESHTENKGSRKQWDPVTAADKEAEQAIRDHLMRAYPDHHFLGEESSRADSAERAGSPADHLWIIDPIDGTANFVHGIPHYGVSVAYAEAGRVMAAACLDVERNELFTAIRGQGTRLQGEPIHVSSATTLSDAMVCTGFYYDRGAIMEKTLEAIRSLFGRGIHGIRRSGSAVIDICWLAAGRFDAFFEFELSPWDFAAAALIAEEAGALLARADGSPLTLTTGSFACAPPRLLKELLSVIG